MTTFSQSSEAAFRRLVRDAIRNGPFTKAERDVTLAVINHWFHYRNGPKKFIHPSRAMLAKKAQCSIATVKRCLAMLRASWVLRPLSGLRAGQGMAVRYRVNLGAIFSLCGCDWSDEFLRGVSGSNDPLKMAGMSRQTRVKMTHCLKNVEGCESLNVKPDISSPSETDE